ncbi:NKRF-like protein [Mya arenaria]|uniref:NKRF-like protein n=1 Tax=Mya arenaria TaxID=6604 RepID=A0ABY7GDJ1_MYAAR|nr:NKRF-like protein [Mya arenaria]
MSEQFDVESFRNPNESTTEWKLRRQFLLAHNDKLEPDRLVCLANCYVNVEIYGCTFIVSGHAVATAHGVTKEEAKNNAAKATLDELREMCYTIKVKQSVDSDAGGLTKEQLMSDIEQGTEMLPDSNVGNMLLRKMGWVGGGVGKKGQGQAEPVKAEMVIGRQGLGLKASRGIGKEFNRKVSTMLEDYLKNDEQKDLHFSSELSKEERATIHQIGQKMGLKTNSKGKGDNRYLIVSRKRSAHELLEHVIGSGGSTSKYEVIPPGNGDNDFRRREDIVYGQGKQ